MTNPESTMLQVGDLMTADLMALRPNDTVGRARQVLKDSGLHALPIIDRNDTTGVVTLLDCQGRRNEELLADVVARAPVTISLDASVAEAATLMRSEYIHHLLVTEGSGENAEVVGILSSFDLLKTLCG